MCLIHSASQEFQKAIKSRPLRIRLQPPNSTAWKQASTKVAHFQREVVRLQLKKVLLQKSLRDEHEKAPIASCRI
eukprot:Skav203184  [mRNA]  locus=scaffold39:319413:320656:+ [translate_table: standard]